MLLDQIETTLSQLYNDHFFSGSPQNRSAFSSMLSGETSPHRSKAGSNVAGFYAKSAFVMDVRPILSQGTGSSEAIMSPEGFPVGNS